MFKHYYLPSGSSYYSIKDTVTEETTELTNVMSEYGIPSSIARIDSRSGMLLKPSLGENIYETITIPPVKFYTATYDITLWSQYTQEMNDMLMTIMSLYQNNHQRTFKLETDKGYWFVGFVDSELAPGNNADDFTDDERLIRYSFSIKVAGYVITPEYPGSPSYIRRSVSSPQISFSTVNPVGKFQIENPDLPRRNDPDLHLLKDLYSEYDPMPSVGVGARGASAGIEAVGSKAGGAGASPPGGPVRLRAARGDLRAHGLRRSGARGVGGPCGRGPGRAAPPACMISRHLLEENFSGEPAQGAQQRLTTHSLRASSMPPRSPW